MRATLRRFGRPWRGGGGTRGAAATGGAEADLRLADTGVSRAHAELRLDGSEVRLTDLGSTNGTLVNGRRITSAVLADGDSIEVGATPLLFRREG